MGGRTSCVYTFTPISSINHVPGHPSTTSQCTCIHVYIYTSTNMSRQINYEKLRHAEKLNGIVLKDRRRYHSRLVHLISRGLEDVGKRMHPARNLSMGRWVERGMRPAGVLFILFQEAMVLRIYFISRSNEEVVRVLVRHACEVYQCSHRRLLQSGCHRIGYLGRGRSWIMYWSGCVIR
ncbi:hypothetical protein BU24DRAFT_53810 [Aaosphaeria arxii CBS 175.79]|uniref:Uncharacterized protein n=1 Tax=Aaosphaeria arxii CBS 175.79 TaxID=1450172 RepID=A0A6A5XFI3_9PLEO|nr:uncharacterized protein BU24DRAFT_53810 [Aaosphaeria arxii CBS 175.79]KAF2011134.1 hypothetical protein BU24DRAFT_53810 [Aaosphaeria arxii CBS 175.79]